MDRARVIQTFYRNSLKFSVVRNGMGDKNNPCILIACHVWNNDIFETDVTLAA